MKIHRGNFFSNADFVVNSGILSKDHALLEIGSGNGAMVDYLKNLGYNITGTEVTQEYIDFAKEHYSVGLAYVEGDSLTFDDGTFNTVMSFDVFEHIPDSDKHLQEVSRVLKDGGTYIIVTPNKITNIPFEILKEKSFTKYREYHCSLHTYWELKKRLLRNGFEPTFHFVPVINDYFVEKMEKQLGRLLTRLSLSVFRPDSWPIPFRTNFYVEAVKRTSHY